MQTKPSLQLSGLDGNSFMILGRAKAAAWAAGWSTGKINAFIADAKSGDYDHLVQTTMEHFDVS